MKQPNIVIVDYKIGNISSIINTLKLLGYNKIKYTSDSQELINSDVLILPGVGAFDEAIKNLNNLTNFSLLNELVLINKKPILGICVGMQLFAKSSSENGFHNGLNWIDGEVIKLELPSNLLIPHVGWNNIEIKKSTSLFSNYKDKSHFYFDHSYHFVCEDKFVTSICNYGININSSIQNENIFGVQFHPEKSQNAGLRLFRSFFNSL
jgi:glutamine amidotransferase